MRLFRGALLGVFILASAAAVAQYGPGGTPLGPSGGSGSGTTPGGANTQVEFNDGGTFAGNAAFTFNKTTGVTTQSPSAPTTAGGDILNFNSAAVSALSTVPHTNSQRIIGADNQISALYLDSYGPNDGSLVNFRTIINMRAARGTGAAILASKSGDELGRISGRGAVAGDFTNSLASLSFIAAQDFTSANQGTFLAARTTPLNTAGNGTTATPPVVGSFAPSGSLIVGKTVQLSTLTMSVTAGTMTVTAQSGTPLAVGQYVATYGISGSTTDAQITALGTGVGGTGTYTVSPAFTSLTSTATTSYKFFALDTANDLGAGWGNFQTGIALNGATSGILKMSVPAVAGTNQITWPAGTTDFSATGGTTGAAAFVLKQASVGGPLTVAAPAGWITLKKATTDQTVANTAAKVTSWSVTIPANTLGLNGALRFTAVFKFTNTNGTKQVGVDLGGTTLWSSAASSSSTLGYAVPVTTIYNRNSASSQVGGLTVINAPAVGTVPATSSIDTTQDQTLTFWITLGSASDTGVLQAGQVEVNNDNP